ncbi:hypothetical protein Y032_0473g2105 [Ancylostoma ceylanicum]|uniref:Uncharacterized protein n=1 Tax=Ancylostoma ceylanicum TaxID=53326 RepID=A0A016WXV8_9BILA|nr:hypothetical protein Y032_0473g2105 [Ancylostoma ceylanicum]
MLPMNLHIPDLLTYADDRSLQGSMGLKKAKFQKPRELSLQPNIIDKSNDSVPMVKPTGNLTFNHKVRKVLTGFMDIKFLQKKLVHSAVGSNPSCESS